MSGEATNGGHWGFWWLDGLTNEAVGLPNISLTACDQAPHVVGYSSATYPLHLFHTLILPEDRGRLKSLLQVRANSHLLGTLAECRPKICPSRSLSCLAHSRHVLVVAIGSLLRISDFDSESLETVRIQFQDVAREDHV